MNKVLRIDILMLALFVASLLTGVGIYYADHFQSHDEWHNWSVAHVVANLFFLVVAIVHIKQHWAWYKSLFKSITRKSKVTIFVTVAFLCASISGIYLLLFADGQGTSEGLAHLWIGGIFGLSGILHFAMRCRILLKFLK